jgi:ATP-dependent helicase HepA
MSNLRSFAVGQRWRSETEPELGLGVILAADQRTVQISFPAREEIRQYSVETAPLKRVIFRVGDLVTTRTGSTLKVQEIQNSDDLFIYQAGSTRVPESELAANVSVTGPEERILGSDFDPSRAFDLRYETLQHSHRLESSAARGFLGARISLIPHQLYIASEVANRHAPRVLLADEVGLGKTIEACLILHRLLATGRVNRVLILTPESLVNQWFVELLRRFNLLFKIYDADRCGPAGTGDGNPFLDEQWVLSSIHWLAADSLRSAEAIAADWDLLIVDEAHHLRAGDANSSTASPEYELVRALSLKVPSLLLLTATPEQLGLASHFSRLHLLDPARFHDFDAFQREVEEFQPVAKLADKIVQDEKLTAAEKRSLKEKGFSEKEDKESLLADLLDRHGPGRVIFRNTRRSIPGFPKRRAHLQPLDLEPVSELHQQLSEEFSADCQNSPGLDFLPEYEDDPRIVWLKELLTRFPDQKFLLICRTQQKIEAIEEALRGKVKIKVGLFHEKLTLLQRDRNAAWFSEPDGARLLLCSEIGSEGRNFQFAHHLILFDLPLDPELLEQRIGRLDRIGQSSEINIHVPVIKLSPQEVLARWYHEALNAFEHNLEGGGELMDQFGEQLRHLAFDFHETRDEPGLKKLIHASRLARLELEKKLERGRDRLLELGSFKPERAKKIVSEVNALERASQLRDYLFDAFENMSIKIEEIAPETFVLGGGDLVVDAFPGLKPEGMTVTLRREIALSRDDVGFVTWEHPLMTGLIDAVLGADKGNSAFSVAAGSVGKPSLYLEALFKLEASAPEHLHMERFLAPTPIRVVVNHRLADFTEKVGSAEFQKRLRDAPETLKEGQRALIEKLLPQMLEAASELARKKRNEIVERTAPLMARELTHEVERLQALRKVNPNVREAEIELAVKFQGELTTKLAEAQVRVDALRLIWEGDVP